MIRLLLTAALVLPLLAFAASESDVDCCCGQCDAGCTCCIDGACSCSECVCVLCGTAADASADASAELSTTAKPSCCAGGQCSMAKDDIE